VTPASHPVARRLVDTVATVLRGKEAEIELAVACLLARGHLLVEDVPGVGKTTLARALSRAIGLELRRVQCTSDLMPSDLVGSNVYAANRGTFEWRPGPVFTDILLADEINRATPRTQSALLEAMEERQVSVDGTTHPLSPRFFVIATQNPNDFHGTYPLPESQLDRFLLRISLGHPPRAIERRILAERRGEDPVRSIESVVTADELDAARESLDEVVVSDVVLDYLHTFVVDSRDGELFELGASTRSALALERVARAFAIVHGRSYVTPDDVKHLVVPTLAHRLRPRGARDGVEDRAAAERGLRLMLERIPVPV